MEKKTDFGVMFINIFIANNDHIRKIMCYIVTCSVILCHLIKIHVQLNVAHFITYLYVLATPMTTPFLGLNTKMDLSPVLYVLNGNTSYVAYLANAGLAHSQ